ncbi:hypothetical protein B0O80DRAFT_180259 [Mortierella sp. GBAus27b]|nr:hypothetical protein B0O80DRAFT_180259 [Mortierella sp. GBAus27b]
MLTKSQEVVSDVVDELQLVVHKAVLAIASGQIYPSHLGPSQKKGFDVTSLLPPWFAVHASTKTVLDVAPLPIGLHVQRQLEDAYDKKQKSDLLQLFTKEHIQDLYSAFLGTQTTTRTSDKSSWEAIKGAIRSESTTPEPKVEKADGLSRTMLEHITQVATSTTELWSGSIYKKSLDQLITSPPCTNEGEPFTGTGKGTGEEGDQLGPTQARSQ